MPKPRHGITKGYSHEPLSKKNYHRYEEAKKGVRNVEADKDE